MVMAMYAFRKGIATSAKKRDQLVNLDEEDRERDGKVNKTTTQDELLIPIETATIGSSTAGTDAAITGSLNRTQPVAGGEHFVIKI